MIKNTILVPLESYLYLQNLQFRQRIGKERSQKGIEKLIKNFQKFQENGYKQLADGDIGGCIGNPINAFDEGRWTNWNCNEMINILKNAGLSYKIGKQINCI